MINYTPTPDFYNDYICHYNHNHDPKNGQFAKGHGGPGKTIIKKKSKKEEYEIQRKNLNKKEKTRVI